MEIRIGTHGTTSGAPGLQSADVQAFVAAVADAAEKLAAVTDEEIRRANYNGNLSAAGRKAAIEAAWAKHESALDLFEPRVFAADFRKFERELATINTNLDNRFRSPERADERVAGELRRGEVRAALRTITETKRPAVVLRMATDNDVEGLRAVQEAPVSVPIVSSETWRQADELHRQKFHQAELARVAELDGALHLARYNITTCRRSKQNQSADQVAATAADQTAASAAIRTIASAPGVARPAA